MFLKKFADVMGSPVHFLAGAPAFLFVAADVLYGPDGGQSGSSQVLHAAWAVVCAVVYLVVWAAFNIIESVITLSPFSFVDPFLKAGRMLLLGGVQLLGELHPVLGFLAAVCIFVFSLWVLHFSIRCTVASLVYSFGFLGRMLGMRPYARGPIRAFACWRLRGVPLWSFGQVRYGRDGLEFVYNRLFLFWERVVPLPRSLAVAIGTVNPFVRDNKRDKLILRFSPFYRRNEEYLCDRLEIEQLVDISWQTTVHRGSRSMWEAACGVFGSKPVARRR